MAAECVKRTLKIGLPKGSLENSTFELMGRAGWEVSIGSRSYYPNINDPEMQGIMFRAQEMSRYVENGVVDVGLTGHDWILENGSDVVEVAELIYSKQRRQPARWVVAVPQESPVQKVEDLDGKLIATELVGGYETVLREARHKREGRVFVGRYRGQGAPRRRHRRSHRDRFEPARQ